MTAPLPVSQTEKPFPSGATLVAKTDPWGVLTQVNEAFAELGGYPREALIGADCALLRHPDMPPQVFADMWTTINDNRPWHGVIKNRCRNGDHYWVDAVVVPVRENDASVGYLSVGTEPDREAVRQAEELHRHLAASGAPLRGSASLTDFLSVKSGVVIGIVFVSLLMILGGILGMGGLSLSNDSMETLYRSQLKPAIMIGRISFLMADNRSRVSLGLQDLAHAKAEGRPTANALLARHTDAIEKNKREIAEIWSDFIRVPQYQHEAALVRDYWLARQVYADDGLSRAIEALRAGQLSDAERIFRERVSPLYDEAADRADRLLTQIKRNAEDELQLVLSNNNLIRDIALFGIVGGLLVVACTGTFFLLGVVRPLDQAVAQLERVAGGNLSGAVELDGGGETGRLTRAIAVMQLRLRVIMDEMRHASAGINAECATLNELTEAVVERYGEQHDRLYQVIDATEKTRDDQLAACIQADATLELAERILADDAPDDAGERRRLLASLREITAATHLQVYINEDAAHKLNQVAARLVDNREAAQAAWVAADRMKRTAGELDGMLGYFR